MRSVRWSLAFVALASCGGQREVPQTMRWDLTKTGYCDAPGRLTARGEAEITLRYVKAPDHYEKLCSTRVATHLQAMGRNPVEVVFLYDARTKGRSLCSVDVVKGTLLGGASGKSCADLGHEGGGIELLGSAAPRPDPFATP